MANTQIAMWLYVLGIGFLVLQGSLEGLALKCHQCKNWINGDCFQFEKDHTQFLGECDANATACVAEKKIRGKKEVVIFIRRDCYTSEWKCEGECYTCNSDGCNYLQELAFVGPITLKATKMEVIEGNYYPSMGIGLLATLLLIWIIIKVFYRNMVDEDDNYEEEGENDIEYDESDGDVDEKMEGVEQEEANEEADEEEYEEVYDSIEKEYKDNAQDAEYSYNKLKRETVLHIHD